MIKTRIIPVILMKNGRIVQSKRFKRFQALGNPSTMVGRLSNWFCDELIYLDISRDSNYNLNRDDLKDPNRTDLLELIDDVSKNCFMPLTIGGRIKNIDDIYQRLAHGADKVAINTQAFLNPGFIQDAANKFGSQCIVVSVDVKKTEQHEWEVFIDRGQRATGVSVFDWLRIAEDNGAGEILLNSIDKDGTGEGYDLELLKSAKKQLAVPLIAMGGVGHWNHLSEGIQQAKVDAVAAANIFQYTENAVHEAKKALYESGHHVRKPVVQSIVRTGER